MFIFYSSSPEIGSNQDVPCKLTKALYYSDNWSKTDTNTFIPVVETLTMFDRQLLLKLWIWILINGPQTLVINTAF